MSRSEPLTDLAIVLLDEPTLGLDSTTAVALMRILHDLARDEGKTIITSIHQPSSAVFFAFDALMLLADGKVVYLSTPNGSLEYVRDRGLECPGGYNAADHHMDLLVVDGAIEYDDDDDDDDGGGDGDNQEGENDQTGGGVEDDGSGSSTEEEDGRGDNHKAPAHRIVGRRGVRKAHRG